MPTLLHIETATAVCSAAISRDGKLLALRETLEPQAHAAMLAVFIRELFDEIGIKAPDLDAVSYSSGPGSYTGLRIGISTAKGLCFAADRPLIAIPTLDALAFAATSVVQAGDRIIPMLDARRMEVYTQVYDFSGHPESGPEALVLDEQAFAALLAQGPVWFLGDALTKARPLLSAHPNARFLPDVLCSAQHHAQPALRAWEAGRFEHLGLSEPFYLKEFVAGKGSVLPGPAQG